jgi:acetyl esterase/lipase
LSSTSKVTVPTLTLFLPNSKKSNGTAVVICPGGGYSHLAIDKEGFKVASWLNTLGITAFVLKYRLPSDWIMENKTIGPLQDAQEAIRMVRRHANTWNINPEKIGIMGFSAGGHLASTLSTHYLDDVYVHDSISAKPNFSILIYPVISMENEITHKGSRTNLLGNVPSEDLMVLYSNEKQIDSLTPPTFLIHATDDKAVPVENSIQYYMALKDNNIPVEMHIFENGGHGFGLGVKDTSLYWTDSCEQWLKSNKYID